MILRLHDILGLMDSLLSFIACCVSVRIVNIDSIINSVFC